MSEDIVVVIGTGGIGLAIARRQGAGKRVLLADFNTDTLDGVGGQGAEGTGSPGEHPAG
jgi:NAD(P)-dependent dehydrogenase (short-subunit alcohol dehydrogenase family)